MQPRLRQSTTAARPVKPKETRAGKRPVERPVDFVLRLPQAESVALAGTFNDWDVTRTPLRVAARGMWKTTVWLPAGRYEYRFVADGVWMSDPHARESVPNSFGSTNSVLLVG